MSPPIHIEVTISSTPSSLETPKPAITATVQTGQTASASRAKNEELKASSDKTKMKVKTHLEIL